jgi:hypothetical protein
MIRELQLTQVLRIILFFLTFVSCNLTRAQQDSVWRSAPTVSFLGFADAYYAFDFNKPELNRQPFLFNHNRHNQFSVNNVLVQTELHHEKYRATLGLHTGTYAMDNYANEPALNRFMYQANVGISLSKKNKVWLDAGVLPSHMGFETALSIENKTLTRSLVAENSPYYLTGAKLTYSISEKWELAGIICNGWQQIQRSAGSSIPAGGTQLIFSPSNKVKLNWSTFISSVYPDSTRRMRYFSNLYAEFQLGKQFNLIAGFDSGMEQAQKGSSNYLPWFSPVIIAQVALREKWKLAVRAEYYQDRHNVIIPALNAPGFSTFSSSLNIDFVPIPQVACRLEGRMLLDEHAIYPNSVSSSRTNFFVAASIAIQFEKIWK